MGNCATFSQSFCLSLGKGRGPLALEGYVAYEFFLIFVQASKILYCTDVNIRYVDSQIFLSEH